MTTTETPTSSIKELHRSREDRILAGVAGGLGRYFDLSPTFFRIAFVILTLVGGAGILIYVAAALVIPDEGRTDSIASEALRRHRDRPWLLAGVALVAIAVVSLVAQADFWPNSGFAWTLLLLGGAAIVIAQRRGNDGEPAPETGTEVRAPRQPSLFLPVFGLLLAAAGALALLEATGTDVPWTIALAAGAIAIGVVVAAGSVLRRRTGGPRRRRRHPRDARGHGLRHRRPSRRADRRPHVPPVRHSERRARLRRLDREPEGRPDERRALRRPPARCERRHRQAACDRSVRRRRRRRGYRVGGRRGRVRPPRRRSERKGVARASAIPTRATRCTSTPTSASGRSSSRGSSASSDGRRRHDPRPRPRQRRGRGRSRGNRAHARGRPDARAPALRAARRSPAVRGSCSTSRPRS